MHLSLCAVIIYELFCTNGAPYLGELLFELGEGSPSFQEDNAQAPTYSITLVDILNFVMGSTEFPLQAS